MNAFGSGTLVIKPPEKGSFPLDHDGACKEDVRDFLLCMKQREGNHLSCRDVSRKYLECRMNKGLMQPEDLNKLGFDASYGNIKVAPSNEGRKEDEGFVSGMGIKGDRFQQPRVSTKK